MRSQFALAYATHLGFRSFDTPLFAHAARSTDPVDQIAFARENGFSGIQDPWFSARPENDKARIAAAIGVSGLLVGTLGVGGLSDLRKPLYFPSTPDDNASLEHAWNTAFADAALIGATDLALVPATDPSLEQHAAEDAFARHITIMADRAAEKGLMLNIEVVDSTTIPGQLFTRFTQAAAFVRRISHPTVRLIYDTGHLIQTDGDLIEHLTRSADIIGPVQIAGQPGRCEPSSDQARILPVLEHLAKSGHSGLVELEHLWTAASESTERAGIDWLQSIDPHLHSLAEKGPKYEL